MIKAEKPLLTALAKKEGSHVPFWFMRQAGRYLPEYQKLRKECGSFWELCLTPELAAEVTLQPLRRFDMDAAILFADILVIPFALGREVVFREGDGPTLQPIRSESEIALLTVDQVEENAAPVFETVRRVKAALPEGKTLIGFAGSPWTVACYMIEGRGSRDFMSARRTSAISPAIFSKLIDVLTEASIRYLRQQVQAGAEVLQLFDSWAGIASVREFRDYIVVPTRKIVSALKKEFPELPIIGFPKGAGVLLEEYIQATGVDAVSVDYTIPPSWAATHLQPHAVVQGNLDPLLLADNLSLALAEAKNIRQALGSKPFIFNLGHGMLPHTPISHVEALCDYLKADA